MKRTLAFLLVLLGLIPVLAQEAQITVGQAAEQHYAPIYCTRGISLYQCVYSEEDIGRPGIIAGITLYTQMTYGLQPFPIKVWLGTTPDPDLSAGTVPSTAMTLVYDGNININMGTSTLFLPFSNPFPYQSDNLVLMIYKPSVSFLVANPCKFDGYRTVQPLTSKFFWNQNQGYSYNPENPPQTTTDTNFIPKTTFHMLPLYNGPRLVCIPQTLEFDPTWEAHERQATVKLSNPGNRNFQITGLQLSDPDNYGFVNMPALPLTLEPGDIVPLTIRYLPVAIGEDPATLRIFTRITNPLNFIVDERAVTEIYLRGVCGDAFISSAPQTFGFDEATPPKLPDYWSSIIAPATQTCWVYTTTDNPHSSPTCAILKRQSTSTAALYLISPPMAPSLDASSKRLRFYARAYGTSGSFSVGVMSDPTDPATFRFIKSISLSGQNLQWTLCHVNLGTVLPYEQHFAFRTNESDHITVFFDDIILEDYPQYDLQAVSLINPPTVQPGSVSTISVVIKNWGRYTENNYTVKIFRSDGVELASTPGLAISPLGSREVPALWTPSGHGALNFYAKVVWDEDLVPANDSTLTGQIFIMTPDGQSIDVGQPQTYGNLPFSFTQNTFLSESLFRASELGTATGMLEAILLKPHTYVGIPPKHIKIWLGFTDQTYLGNGWIPASELTLVFDGMVQFGPGLEWMLITLDTPFLYESYRNLVMLTQHPWEPNTIPATHYFWQVSGTAFDRTLTAGSDLPYINPEDPGFTTEVYSRPLVKFIKDPGFMGNIQGTVTYPGGQPVVGAAITIPLRNVGVTSDLSGAYSIPNIPMGEVEIICHLNGYFEIVNHLNLSEGQTLSHNFIMQTIPLVQVSGTVLASDTGLPLPNTLVYLTGYQTYSDFTDAAGQFVFPTIYGGLDYSYNLSHTAYAYGPSSGTIHIPLGGGNLGNLYISEPTTAPTNVTADLNPLVMSVFISWEADTSARELLGYRVWRLPFDQTADPTAWTLLTPEMITAVGFTDLAFVYASQNGYIWAVKSVYNNGVTSAPAFSNRVYSLSTKGLLAGRLTTQYGGYPIVNAAISLGYNYDNVVTYSDAQGNFYYMLYPGTYHLYVEGHDGWQVYIWNGNFTITSGEVTQLDLELEPEVDANDPTVPPLRTELKQNFPNPFREMTTLRFLLGESAPVNIDIYNIRGQLVRSLLRETKAAGTHELVWDGRDAGGNPVGNGVYICRMTCGKFSATRKLLRE